MIQLKLISRMHLFQWICLDQSEFIHELNVESLSEHMLTLGRLREGQKKCVSVQFTGFLATGNCVLM